MPSFWQYFKERNRRSIPLVVIMALYTAFCIASLVYFAICGGDHARDCLISLTYFVVAPAFYLLEYVLRIRSPFPYTLFILVYCVFCFLGASYNFYTLIPFLDDILHACWGLLFVTIGFSIIKSLLGEPVTAKQFAVCILFGIGFCMLLSVLWEIYEFTFDSTLAEYDMQEDTIVTHIHSFMLHTPYDHLHTFKVDGIAYTQLFDADGNLLYTIEGGYLDIGLVDTMMDLIWCVAASAVFAIVLAIDRRFGSKLYPHIIPVYVGKEGKREETETEN